MTKWLTPITAQRIPAAIDNLEAGMFGGRLEKAMLVVYDCTDGGLTLGSPKKTLEFYLNPNTIQVAKEVDFAEAPTAALVNEIKYSNTKPVCLSLGELWFDTYDTRENVRRKYIDELEVLLDYEPETHNLNVVRFVWGEFGNAKTDKGYNFLVSKLSVDYTLFLSSGMPVRAKVALCPRQITTAKKQNVEAPKESPDHAKIYTVKRGDTLQGIARFAYNDPREWRRIAQTNKLEDPMQLVPGTALLLPPILK